MIDHDRTIVETLADRPELREVASALHGVSWPPFTSKGAAVRRYWNALYTDFPEFQFVLRDEQGQVMGAGNAVPLRWDGSPEHLPAGWDQAVEEGVTRAVPPNTLCALAAVVHPEHRGLGVSAKIIQAMKDLAARHSLRFLIAPVRPTLKERYPLIPMERYVTWRRSDGTAFDPWLRVHLAVGGVILGVAPRSTVIEGSVREWEEWAGMALPDTGSYVVPGALAPLGVDREQDRAIYVEPNVWALHRVAEQVIARTAGALKGAEAPLLASALREAAEEAIATETVRRGGK